MKYNIPYGKQTITQEDIDAVVGVLQSDYLTQGPHIKKFEEAFATYVGAHYAVAVSNGTAALHLCALALDVKAGQKVITTPITFAASANCVSYCGGEVVFCDIDPETYLIDIEQVRSMLEAAPKGTYHGIIPVDFAGRAVDLEKLKQLASAYDLWIIEDSCHAPGGYFTSSAGKKESCGNGNYSDLAIFSFHPVKHIACGEGGMITTNDPVLYEKLLLLRTHGITKDPTRFKHLPEQVGGDETFPGWYMEMQLLGYNYRLTDFQAALGISQLKSADAGLERRRQIAATYFEAFKGEKEILSQSGDIDGHAYHLYIIHVKNRLGLYNYLKSLGIYCQIHYVPTHIMPYYQDKGWKFGDLPIAEQYYETCISLPMYPSLTNDELGYVIEAVKKFLNG